MPDTHDIDDYHAFISYSHEDRKAAETLLRKLQTYRIPVRRQDSQNSRLGPFFMDRETLPAADSLDAAILNGLQAARSMIVLCSPAAVQSQWVNREIKTFRDLHPAAPIFPVILNENGTIGELPTGLFPAALLDSEKEPLAADLRKHGDGYKLGFLKLVSALTDIPLSQLLRRDASRRNRRVTLITAASVFLVTIMSVLAFRANVARQEADTRRAEVEGMVDFMLNDLKAQLEPVGRLDVLEGVAQQAITYYEGQNTDALACDATIRNARAFHLSTEIYLNQDKLDLASAAAQQAVDLIKRKKPECGSIPAFMVTEGHSEYWAASPIWRQIAAVEIGATFTKSEYESLLLSLLPYYERYDTAVAPLATIADQENVFAQEAADNAINFGSVYYYLNRVDEAQAYFAKAIEYIAPAALDDDAIPADAGQLTQKKQALLTLANAYGWSAGISEHLKAYQDALGAREEERLITKSLAERNAGSIDTPALAQSLQAEMAILRLRARMSDPSLSLSEFKALEASLLSLTESDPENATWQDLLLKVQQVGRGYQSLLKSP